MMMQPAEFHANPQTKATNQYQHDNPDDTRTIHEAAVEEFKNLRDTLVENGVIVTSVIGQGECPDDVFCNNWVSTHAPARGLPDDHKGRMVLYPMLAPNRRTERRPELMKVLNYYYDVTLDITAEEREGRFLESTGSIWHDRVNDIGYCGLSGRTDKELAQKTADALGIKIHFFETENHAGKPVYHTDVMMFIGSGYAGICSECILPKDRERILGELSKTHEIIDLSMDQLRQFCGNSLEVRGRGGEKMLAMSGGAYDALTGDQKDVILKYVTKIIHSPIPTIEKYGGGSCRCMLLEMM